MWVPFFLFLINFSFSQAQTRQEICSGENPQEALFESRSIVELTRAFTQFQKVGQENPLPLEDQTAIAAGLNQALNSLHSQREISSELITLVRGLSSYQQELLGYVFNTFIEEHAQGRLLIELELTSSNDPNKYEKRQELIAQMKQALVEQYQESLTLVLLDIDELSDTDKTFLVENIFNLLPEGPRYQWTEAATQLHDYVWWLKHNFNIMPTTGNLTHGAYWLETNVFSQGFGMNLNIALRYPENPVEDMNIQLTYSPLTQEIKTSLCQFSMETNRCDLISLEQWCSL